MDTKRIRLKTGDTQKEFAKTIGVSERSVVLWETGKRVPRASSLKRIIAYCKEHGIKYLEDL